MAKEKKELSKTEQLMRAWFAYNYWNSCCEDEAIDWSQHGFNLSATELEAFLEWIEEFTHDVDNANWFRKVINNDIKDGVGELEFVENHKGWGYDYLVRIEISPLYCF